jgi:hypothetical protein
VGLQDLFGPGDDARLRSGFATRIVIRVELARTGKTRGAEEVVARAARQSDLSYDIWDERFRVRIWNQDATAAETIELRDMASAVVHATTLARFPVAELARVPPGRYHLRFRADLNPISEETAADVRRWLVRPPGQGRAAGNSVFGSFVSIFVNPRVEESERQITFWSFPFEEPPP